MNPPLVLIVAGGTGGHISPGVALIEELQARGAETAILTLNKNAAYPDIAECGAHVHLYDAPPFPSSVKSLLLYPLRIARAAWQAVRVVKSYNVLVGMGGYPTIPALMAAVLLRRRIFLCEQNAVPGQVTRLFARFARGIFLTFPVDQSLPRAEITGNPVRKKLIAKRKRRPEKAVLILGGSQGARQLNEIMSGLLLDEKQSWTRKIHFFLQCGNAHVQTMQARLGGLKNVTLFGFHSNIQELYAKAAVLVSRSGAGILTEAMLFGLPMILVPLATAKDDHQRANARVAERAGAAVMLDQTDSSHDAMAKALRELLESAPRLKSMSKESSALFFDRAASQIIDRVLR